MSHEQKPHHHQHSKARRNWLLPLACVAMIVGGGYWMNATSSDPNAQPPAGPMHTGAFGSVPGDASSATVVQPEPGMENVSPPPGESAVSGLPQGMGAEHGVGTMSGMGPSRLGASSQTMKR